MTTARPTLQFLGLTAPAPRTPAPRAAKAPRSIRAADPAARSTSTTFVGPARPVRRTALSPIFGALRWLGLVQQPIPIGGHPRIQARFHANLVARQRRDRMLALSLFLVIAAGLIGYGLVRSPLLTVDRVSVKGLTPAQQVALGTAIEVGEGTNIMDVDLAAVTAAVSANPWVDGVTVSRRLPSAIEVRVGVTHPVLTGVFGQTQYLMDADGTVLERATVGEGSDVFDGDTVSELPTVTLFTEPTVGDTTDLIVAQDAAAIAAQMPTAVQAWVTSYTPAENGEVDAVMQVPVTAEDGAQDGTIEFVAHLGRATDVSEKAATLAALVEEILARGLTPAALDVRIPDRPFVQT